MSTKVSIVHNEWDSGIGSIDSEHRSLVRKGNELLNLALVPQQPERAKELLSIIVADIQEHFAHEEKILTRAKYPDLEKHAAIHRALIADTEMVRDNLDHELIDPSVLFHLLVDKIIVEHMQSDDADFFPYLAKKGVS